MKKTAFQWYGRSVLAVMAVFAGACAGDTPVAPRAIATTQGVTALGDVTDGNRLPDLTACPELAAPEGSTLVLQAFGVGVQIYRWDGATWRFVAPRATLYADAENKGVVATHFGGPTWKSNSEGAVVGKLFKECTPNAAAIPWLSLTATPDGPGIFEKVKFIQRLNTVGGRAPSTPGAFVGQEAEVPYKSDYLFYQTQ